MNDQERYQFDLQGFLVVDQAIAPAHLAKLNRILDINLRHRSAESPSATSERFDGLLGWGSAYRALIDNPRLRPYLAMLLGPQFRLDHEYAHVIRQGVGPIGTQLHGGGTPYDPCQHYQVVNGQMQSGLVAVAYNLTEVKPGEGGFGCIPGSHKSNFPLPEAWRDLQRPPACAQAVPAPAGSATLFTEALSHGTLPWRGQGDRRTLFFKFSPQHLAWMRRYYDLDCYGPDACPDLTEAQRARLKPPGIWP
jgi:ectoine hydroxylase-related dioxygenase (phytanoyl-CoA dioxygenase family)